MVARRRGERSYGARISSALVDGGAIDAFFEAFGVDPQAPEPEKLRTALYLLGTVIEGSSAVFWTRDQSGQAFQSVRAMAIEVGGPHREEPRPASHANDNSVASPEPLAKADLS